jgi:hypothetical protein
MRLADGSPLIAECSLIVTDWHRTPELALSSLLKAPALQGEASEGPQARDVLSVVLDEARPLPVSEDRGLELLAEEQEEPVRDPATMYQARFH